MKHFLLFIKNVFESALVGVIGYILMFIICGVYKDHLQGSGGVILASELAGLQIAPWIIAVFAAAFWMKILNDKE